MDFDRDGDDNVDHIHGEDEKIEEQYVTADRAMTRGQHTEKGHLSFSTEKIGFSVTAVLGYLDICINQTNSLMVDERGFIRAGYCTSRRPSVAIRSRDSGLNWLDFYVIQLLEDEIERLLSGPDGVVKISLYYVDLYIDDVMTKS
uniref:Uncharacterized protein n=1 Tax=Magallana gigas TaxID=29159 RepID=K1R665_MAGGI